MLIAAFLLASLASVFFPVVALLVLANQSSRWVAEGGRGRRVVVGAVAVLMLSAWAAGLVALEELARRAIEHPHFHA